MRSHRRGFGALWTATCDRPGLARIDPVRNVQKGFVSLPIPTTLDGEGSIGAGAGGVWLVGPSSGSGAAIVGFGAVWVSAHD
jgi:hypothetical protein